MRILCSSLLLSLALSSSLVAHAQNDSEQTVTALVEALRRAAPKTASVNDGLYSDWQVKPETLRGWTRRCFKKDVTPTQFDKNAALARQVVSCVVRSELSKMLSTTTDETAAVRSLACWWMTGKYTGCTSGFSGDYVRKVTRYYQEARGGGNRNSPR